jgi:hypothetical protein
LFTIFSKFIGLPKPPEKKSELQVEGKLNEPLAGESSTPSFLKVALCSYYRPSLKQAEKLYILLSMR